MPAIVSHYLLAHTVLEELSASLPELNINRNAFYWGASGPDLFFCHRMLPHQRGRSLHSFGSEMHNKPADKMLNYLVSYARRRKDDIAMSYALGFITHYAYDSTAHPFILYSADVMSYLHPEKHASVWHNQIESALDSIMLYARRGQTISHFKLQSAAALDREVNLSIAGALQGYLLYAFGCGTYVSEIVQAQKDWHFSLAALNDCYGVKYQIVSHAEKLIGLSPMLSPVFRRNCPDLSYDPANLQHAPWYNAFSGTEHTFSFPELTEQAEQLSLTLISAVLSGKALTPEQCFASFSGH